MIRILAFCFGLLLSICPLLPDNNSSALANLGIDARVVSQEERDQIAEAAEITRSTERFDTGNIHSLAIDASDPKYFYVGFDDSITNGTYIECFTIDETYQYTIQFHQSGSYRIFSESGMLYLYIVRGSWVISFDRDGNVAEAYELNSNSRSSNDEVLDSLCNQTKYEVDGKTFEVGNTTWFSTPEFGTYSYLKVTDQDESTHYLYQKIESSYWTSLILVLILVVSVIIIISKHIDDRRENGDSSKSS